MILPSENCIESSEDCVKWIFLQAIRHDHWNDNLTPGEVMKLRNTKAQRKEE